MLFIKPKRPAQPSADEIASIDNVVDAEAIVIDSDDVAPPAAKSGFAFRMKPKTGEAAHTKLEAKSKKTPWSGLFGGAKVPVDAHPDAPTTAEDHVKPQENGTPEEKAKKAKKARPEKAPKPQKPRKVKADGAVYLSLDVGSGSNVYWKVGKDSLEAVEPLSGGRALSFSPVDTLIEADVTMSNSAAQDLAVGETGEDVVIVNASKAHNLVVATPKERVYGNPVRLAPGTLALASLLKEQPKPTSPRVVGFDLRGGEQHVLILFVWGPDGIGLAPCQVVVNPGDIGFTVSEFAASRRLSAEDVNALFFDNAELIAASAKAPFYPNEAAILGLPATRALAYGALLSVVAAAVVSGYSFTKYQELTALKGRAAGAQASLKRTEAAAAEALAERIPSFARAQSLDARRSFERARQLWVPSTTVLLEAKLDGDAFEIAMPLLRGPQVGTSPSVAQALTPEELAALVDLSAPKDCSRTGLTVNGMLNEVQLSVTCENGNLGFTRYRLD